MTAVATDVLSGFSAQLTNLTETISKSIVEVKSRKRQAASGFVWRDHLIVTAEEALAGSNAVSVTVEGRELPAALIGSDPSTGIALIRAEGLSAPPLPLILEFHPKAGTLAIAIGRRAEGVTFRLGAVSLAGGPWRSMRGGHIDRLIRLDMTLDRRAEGGAIVGSDGRAFGMALRGPRRSVLAIPAATIERIAPRILEHGPVRPGYLGLGLHPVQVKTSGGEPIQGLIVLGVAPGGPGEAGGVLQGDILTAWNGESIGGLRSLFRKLGPDAAGQSAELNLIRAGQPLSVRCAIGTRPEA
jgi:S1-C subfamily serine protease